ncbi:abscisic acid receptor pyl4, partial [Phtheirospermum japonicum]
TTPTQPAPTSVATAVSQHISAPVPTRWVRRPAASTTAGLQSTLVKSCHVIPRDGDVRTLREVRTVHHLRLRGSSSTERLEILDDERHVISLQRRRADHRLANYRVVDVPQGNTKEETCVFVDTIVKCNLQSLAQIAENLDRRNP